MKIVLLKGKKQEEIISINYFNDVIVFNTNSGLYACSRGDNNPKKLKDFVKGA